MYTYKQIRTLTGPLFYEAMTDVDYKKLHPRARGGNQLRSLAWIGDTIIELAAREHVLTMLDEGELSTATSKRAGTLLERYVTKTALAPIIPTLGLMPYVRTTKLKAGRELSERVEALVGAVYERRGTTEAVLFVHLNILVPIDTHFKQLPTSYTIHKRNLAAAKRGRREAQAPVEYVYTPSPSITRSDKPFIGRISSIRSVVTIAGSLPLEEKKAIYAEMSKINRFVRGHQKKRSLRLKHICEFIRNCGYQFTTLPK